MVEHAIIDFDAANTAPGFGRGNEMGHLDVERIGDAIEALIKPDAALAKDVS